MIDKVIKGLTACVTAGLEKACPADCPYFLICFPDVGPADPFVPLMQDALALLKEQEPVPVPEDKINKCECGKTVCRYWHPKFCGFCGRELLWY